MNPQTYNKEQKFKSDISSAIYYFADYGIISDKHEADLKTIETTRALELLKEIINEYERLI